MTLRYLFIAVAFLLLVGTIMLFIYNQLVTYRNKVKEAWSSINIQLKRRYSLIPSLTEIVKGYAEHEMKIFDDLSETHQRSIDADTVEKQSEAEDKLTDILHHVISMGVKFPELKANENFLEMQKSVFEVEDNIQRSRRYYNALVREYNTYIEKFPAVVVANMLGFDEYSYFEIGNELEVQNQKIKF